ncbi:MAG TPA: hypothetical protein VIK65_00850 [Candidatus Limnocylindrales bacterium]|jgi:hypothetical protein
MARLRPDQLDRELGAWLRDESATRAPGHLVEEVFARTSRTRQASRWWPPQVDWLERGRQSEAGVDVGVGARGVLGRIGSRGLPVLAGGVALVLVIALVSLNLRPQVVGPGATSSPSPSPSPSATPFVRPTIPVTPPPTPVATTLGSLAGRSLALGGDAAPIAVTSAFGSMWVADIHANDVRRYDAATMAELARIDVAGGPAWFAVADDALWVTSQNGTGLSRIDPATNTVVAHVGDVPPCAAPVVAFGSLWQAACDANVILRINPVQNTIVDTIPSDGHLFLALVGQELVTLGPDGLARLDVAKRTFTEVRAPAAGADFLASDGTTVWVHNNLGMVRVDPKTGRSIATFPVNGAAAISFSGDHAWLTAPDQGVLEIDLATNTVRRTIPVLPSPLVPVEAGGALWVTDFNASVLWRIDI